MVLGVLFLLIGISIILRAFFNIDIPIVRTCVALFVMFLGVKMLVGGFGWRSSHRVLGKWSVSEDAALFDATDFKYSESDKGNKQYSIVFGSSTIDLSALPLDKKSDTHVEVNTVFGEGVVLLDRNQAITIRTNAVFADAKAPNQDMTAFGTLRYENPDSKSTGGGRLVIHGNAVFSSLKFIYKD